MSSQAEHTAEFRLRDMPGLEFFESEGFKGAARQVTRRGHTADQIIRDLKGRLRKSTLQRPVPRVKHLALHNLLYVPQ
jgi:hypothetical protein